MHKLYNRFVKTMITISLSLALTACGGSNSKKTPDLDPVENSAPVISSTGENSVEAGTAYSYTLVSTDADGDTLTSSTTTLPEWLSFDSTTSVLSGTPGENDAGEHVITLTVTDGIDTVTQSFTVTVTIPEVMNNAPVITSSGITQATVGEAYSYTLTATDADNDTLTMSTTVPGALSWLSFDDTTGILSGMPATGDIASTEIMLTVSDGTDETTEKFTITVTETVVEREVVDFQALPDSYVFNNFNGGISTVIDNPSVSGVNVSSQVVQMQKFVGEVWGGSTLTLPSPMTLEAADNTFTMKVHSDRSVAVLFKLEGMNKELSATHTGNGWEELTFDFADNVIGLLSTVTVIFDLGTMGDADNNPDNWTFHYDDITLPVPEEGSGGDETGEKVTDFEFASASYTFSDFNGGAASVLANPDSSGINISSQVAQMIKSAGETWGGSTLKFATPVAIPENSMVKMKVWSSRAVAVLVKFDDMNAEKTANHTGSGWEELHFDFTGNTSTAETRLTLIFDNGVMGDADNDADNWTFYFDDFTTPIGDDERGDDFVVVGTPYDFEATGFGSSFTWAVFENEDNPALDFVSNPSSSSVNNSTTVAMFTAKKAGQPWAGTETTSENTTPFTMDATNSIVKIMVYKSVISDVALKFSVGAAAQPEIKVANTQINKWEELTFDFSSRIGMAETIGIDSVIVFPDFNLDGRSSDTVNYFDNMRFGHNN